MTTFTNLVCATLVLGTSALHPMEGVEVEFEFGVWKEHYSKSYFGAEHVSRQVTYAANRDFVRSHNLEASKGIHSFTLELNEFADMTNQEYRETMLSFRAGSPSGVESFSPSFGEAPDKWDWRETANIVNPPKNQGSCGSCWAFSAVASMEGALNQKTGKLNELSEQELVDCVNDGANTCSLGGEMYQGIEYGISKGMMAESDYSYKGSSGNKCAFDASKSVHTFSGYKNITSGDEAALKEATYAQPIISVGIDASSLWFQLYFGGVYDHKGCKNKAEELDHGVAVVGYGTDGSKDYWWVRNSWGKLWGKSGYIMMSRNNDNQCGVATQACFAEV